MNRILIIGATSAIAEATARRFAARGDALFLLGRDAEKLGRICADLRIRGAADTGFALLDANALDQHEARLEQAARALGGLDIVLIAHGTLGDQAAGERDFGVALRELNTNAISVLSLLSHLANRMEAQRAGQIAVIGSVAGDRGRASNYIYGTAKAAVATWCEGLRGRLHRAGVNVLLVKPGFTDTPMTAAFTKGVLWAQPDDIARRIVGGLDRRAGVVYAPAFWALIMLLIRHIPGALFKRLKL